MIIASKRSAVVTISENLGRSQKLQVCELSDIDYLITDLPDDAPQFVGYRREGLVVL